MKTTTELRSEINSTVATQLALTEAAEKESRAFTGEEQTQYDELEARFKALNVELTDSERRDEIKKRAAEIQTRMNVAGNRKPSSQPTGRDYRNYSLMRAVRGLVSNRLDGFEAEVNEELRAAGAKLGIDYQGVAIPEWAFTSPEKRAIGSGTDPNALVDQYGGLIEALRNKTVVGALGARFMSGLVGAEVIMPRLVAGAATWATEIAPATDAGSAFTQAKLAPRRLAALLDVSKQFLAQTHFSAEATLVDDLVMAMGIALDSAALNGPAVGLSPIGILNIPGIPSVSFGGNGVPPTWAKVVEMESVLGGNNGLRGEVAYCGSFALIGALKTTPIDAGSGRFLAQGFLSSTQPEMISMNGYRAVASPHMPSNLTVNNLSAMIFGNWNDLIVGTFGAAGVDLTVDPYTLAINGQVRLTTNSYHDTTVRHPQSFVIATDIDTIP
jgi:HK97 family phage major capsid protein